MHVVVLHNFLSLFYILYSQLTVMKKRFNIVLKEQNLLKSINLLNYIN